MRVRHLPARSCLRYAARLPVPNSLDARPRECQSGAAAPRPCDVDRPALSLAKQLDPCLLIGKHGSMLISELIHELQSLQTQHGDIEVEVRNLAGDAAPVDSIDSEETRWGTVIRIDA